MAAKPVLIAKGNLLIGALVNGTTFTGYLCFHFPNMAQGLLNYYGILSFKLAYSRLGE